MTFVNYKIVTMQNLIIFFSISTIILISNIKQCDSSIAKLIRLPLQRATTQSVGEYGQPIVNYYANVLIGTPGVSFNIQFDLNAQEHFVPHYSWNPFNRNLHYSNGFQCKSSSTCKKDDRTVSIEYQNCLLTGKRYEDQMILINTNSMQNNSNFTLIVNNTNSSTAATINWKQNFLAISSASDSRFSSLPIDGYFSLSPAPQSQAGLKNLLISLHEAKLIDNLQLSLWFNPILDSQQGGELILGGVDPQRYQGQIYWHHLNSLNYNNWQLNLQYVTLGNQYVSCFNGPQTICQVKFSSGLSDIYGPSEDVKLIYNLLNTSQQSSNLQLIDCRRIPQLPIITFSIDGIPYSLLPSNYIRKTVDGKIFKKETCYVAILPSQTLTTNTSNSNKEWILGTNFLGAYYSIYDLTYRQMGFAALR